MNDFLTFFTTSETPFAILFVILFIWYVRENKEREKRQIQSYEALQKVVETEIKAVQTDLKTMLTIWKILIDNELERREE
jgi:preprotein translocase subunit YajC